MRNPLTPWIVVVLVHLRVWLYILGDRQSVQLRNATTTITTTTTTTTTAAAPTDVYPPPCVPCRAGLQDNVSADLRPKWQKVRHYRATQPRSTDVPDWMTTSAVQPTFWESDIFRLKCRGLLFGTQQVQPWRRVDLGRCHATDPALDY